MEKIFHSYYFLGWNTLYFDYSLLLQQIWIITWFGKNRRNWQAILPRSNSLLPWQKRLSCHVVESKGPQQSVYGLHRLLAVCFSLDTERERRERRELRTKRDWDETSTRQGVSRSSRPSPRGWSHDGSHGGNREPRALQGKFVFLF